MKEKKGGDWAPGEQMPEVTGGGAADRAAYFQRRMWEAQQKRNLAKGQQASVKAKQEEAEARKQIVISALIRLYQEDARAVEALADWQAETIFSDPARFFGGPCPYKLDTLVRKVREFSPEARGQLKGK